MVNNARIADLIRENRADEIHDAIADGSFFEMQTFTQALIELVVAGAVDQEIAANAATNRHDFLVALERALRPTRPRSEPPRRKRPSRRSRAPASAPDGELMDSPLRRSLLIRDSRRS